MKDSFAFLAFWALFVALHVADWYTYSEALYGWFGFFMFGTGVAWFIAALAIHAFLSAHWEWKK